jgi:hypothetical protein
MSPCVFICGFKKILPILNYLPKSVVRKKLQFCTAAYIILGSILIQTFQPVDNAFPCFAQLCLQAAI